MIRNKKKKKKKKDLPQKNECPWVFAQQTWWNTQTHDYYYPDQNHDSKKNINLTSKYECPWVFAQQNYQIHKPI